MKAITANNLLSGGVVFLASGGGWSADAKDASLFVDRDALDAALELAERDQNRQIIVGPYAIDMMLERDGPVPTKLRERIRAQGPTVPYGDDVQLDRFYATQAHFG